MSTITYHGPVGDTIENPTAVFIKELVLDREADYWTQGSGDSSLDIEGIDERLIFFYDEPYGFFIMRHPDYLAPYDENTDIEVVEHLLGGEPMRVPSCCYVSRNQAYKILSEFVENKRIATDINWKDIYEIDFDHGYDF
ncbi:hypothetical protein [Desmospora activa]|uniref:Uncharacterized protein n=1 Tax=Desmospora activa DSM 45169 TaxID=1121389 RepID=A0A2T4Z6L9_9BACL|nr:hypothetical protein [Desmospora activa]PTM57534.1 hypothetical protein C8J48_0082 [Desmospora activa DSM 45169]